MNAKLLVLNDVRASRGRPISALSPDETRLALSAFASLLRHGRQRCWQVAHLLIRHGGEIGPIDGLGPLRSEPVFLLEEGQGLDLSRLSAAADRGARELVLAGLVQNEAGRGLLRHATALGLRPIVVAEGLGENFAGSLTALRALGARAQRAEQIIAETSAQIIWLRRGDDGRRDGGG